MFLNIREALWNTAERAENRSNSRVAREYELAPTGMVSRSTSRSTPRTGRETPEVITPMCSPPPG